LREGGSDSAARGLCLYPLCRCGTSEVFFTRTFDSDVMQSVAIDTLDSCRTVFPGRVVALSAACICVRASARPRLVRCSAGAIFDVVLDLREGSSTFGQWQSCDLDGEDQRSVYIPAGCGHGFQSLTDPADTSYRIDRAHDPSEDVAIAHDDPGLAIPWPLPVRLQPSATGRHQLSPHWGFLPRERPSPPHPGAGL
jgi:dTDP-4-dehydrorhamnose 3,5-epimerase